MTYMDVSDNRSFKGHEFVKLINNTWVLDMNTLVGYKVQTVKGTNIVESYEEAFRVITDNHINQNINGCVIFGINMGVNLFIEKYTRVPVKVLREALNQVNKKLSMVMASGNYR